MFTFTPNQDFLIKTLALESYQRSFGAHGFTANAFSTQIDKPNHASVCSFYIISNRTDDKFRLKLYITELKTRTEVGPFRLMVEENYGSGNLDDEIFVAEAKLDKESFNNLYRYLSSDDFKNNVLRPDDHIASEDGVYKFVSEDNNTPFVFEF